MIDRSHRPIPDVTLKTLAKSFFNNALNYGFKRLDYLRFANFLLQALMDNSTKLDRSPKLTTSEFYSIDSNNIGQLPIDGNSVTLTKLEFQNTLNKLKIPTQEGTTQHSIKSIVNMNKSSTKNVKGLPRSKIATVISRKNNKVIGLIAFVNYDSIHRKAELIVFLDKTVEENQKIKKEAIMLWLSFGIKVLGLQKIYTNTLSTDRNSIMMNEELGFRVEGILQNEIISDNCYRDIVRMRLFANAPVNK